MQRKSATMPTQKKKKCCDSFRWKVKVLNHTYTWIHSPLNSPPIRAKFHVLYSRSLLVIHFKYHSVYMSIPFYMIRQSHSLVSTQMNLKLMSPSNVDIDTYSIKLSK